MRWKKVNKFLVIILFLLTVLIISVDTSYCDPWFPIGHPCEEEQIVDMTIKSGTAFVVTSSYDHCGIYIKEDCLSEQSHWEEITNNIELFPGEYFCSIDVAVHPQFSDSLTIYVGTNNGWPGKLWMSQDKGQTWTAIYDQQDYHACYTVLVDPKDRHKIWIATWPGLKVTENGGDSWVTVDPPNYQYITSICLDPDNPLTVYVSTAGIEFHYSAVFKTIDNGRSWHECSTGLPNNIDWAVMAIDPNASEVLYLIPTFLKIPPWGDQFSIYKSVNGGDWWERQVVSESITHPPFRSAYIQVSPYYQGVIYLGDWWADKISGHLFQSFDSGSTWSPIIDEGVMGISIDPAEPNRVYIAFVDGIWCYEDPLVAVDNYQVDLGLPDDYMLLQNYPNPFNTDTKIAYQIPKDSHMTLQIFNVVGQEIKTLLDDDLTAGSYTATWNGRDAQGSEVSAGIYFCTIKAGEFSQTRKMVLLK
jgi:hypothetical protein